VGAFHMRAVQSSHRYDQNRQKLERFLATAAHSQARPIAVDVTDVHANCPSDSGWMDQFAVWAGRLAEAYPQVEHWKIWNEPDLQLTGRSVWHFGWYGMVDEYI